MGFAKPSPRIMLAGLLPLLAFTAAACNGGDEGQAATGASDWVNTAGTNDGTGASGGPAPVPTPAPTTSAADLYTGDAQFAPYLQKFLDDSKAEGQDTTANTQNPKLEIKLGSISGYGAGAIGLCETGAGLRRVTFDPTYWNNTDQTQRLLLMHHELGHCLLYRGHRTDLLSSGIPASIMYPVLLSDSYYTPNASYYEQELFSQIGSSSAMAGGGQAVPNASQTYVCTGGL